MSGYAPPIQRLIRELSRLPGVGGKTAARLANFLLHDSPEDARRLAESILEVKEKIRLCSICFNLAEGDLCPICADPKRDGETICVVEDPDALIAIEETGTYQGTYHVLHGALAPLDGIGPEDLHIRELIERIRNRATGEVIVATNPNVQGESTAILIMRALGDLPVTVTRIAMGVPMGSDLKYTDRMTIEKALAFRRAL